MAVLAHEVHASTRHGADARWGCNGRGEFAAGYWAPDREYLPDGRFVVTQTWIPHVMSTECRNDLSLNAPRCAGCDRRGSGEVYSAMVLKLGSA